jgi:MFS family permease
MPARIMSASVSVARPSPGGTAELDPRRWWALPVILVGSFLSFLDFFIVNIALPAKREDLGARPAQLQLVVAGYGTVTYFDALSSPLYCNLVLQAATFLLVLWLPRAGLSPRRS